MRATLSCLHQNLWSSLIRDTHVMVHRLFPSFLLALGGGGVREENIRPEFYFHYRCDLHTSFWGDWITTNYAKLHF